MGRREADIKAEKAVVTSGCEVFQFGPKLVNEEEEEADGTCYIQGTGSKGNDSMSVNDAELDVEEIGLEWWERWQVKTMEKRQERQPQDQHCPLMTIDNITCSVT